jgi:hypothetical protein
MAKTSVFGILQKVEEENFGVVNEALKMWSGLLRKKYQGRLRSKNKQKVAPAFIFLFLLQNLRNIFLRRFFKLETSEFENLYFFCAESTKENEH